VRREVPLFITAVIGLFMILSFFVPHQWVSVPADYLQASAIVLVACGYVLGGANVLKVNLVGVIRQHSGWPYQLLLVVSLVATFVIGAIEGPGFLDPGMRSRWIYDRIYMPMSATMFALLAFFIASAAFRAFRIRTVEAALLAIAALIVMIGRVPLTNALMQWAPEPLRLQNVQEWVMNYPQNASKRAIMIGAALGVMATGLRVILGIERSYLSGED
jgi:hypothetical protein